MTRRLEAGPLLVTLGGVLLLVSLFLSWFTGELSAWQAFEVWDLVLFVLALGSIAAGLGLTTQDVDLVDRRFLPAGVTAVAVIVASQIIDPPPAATGQDADTGAWLALGAALVMCAGAVLTFGRVRVALMVEGRDQRRHVSVVDARGSQDPVTDSHEAVAEPERDNRALFTRPRPPEQDSEPEPEPERTGARAAGGSGQEAPARPRRRGGKQPAEEKQD
jgi:hypothetical protein